MLLMLKFNHRQLDQWLNRIVVLMNFLIALLSFIARPGDSVLILGIKMQLF